MFIVLACWIRTRTETKWSKTIRVLQLPSFAIVRTRRNRIIIVYHHSSCATAAAVIIITTPPLLYCTPRTPTTHCEKKNKSEPLHVVLLRRRGRDTVESIHARLLTSVPCAHQNNPTQKRVCVRGDIIIIRPDLQTKRALSRAKEHYRGQPPDNFLDIKKTHAKPQNQLNQKQPTRR